MEPVATLYGHQGNVTEVEISPDGKIAYTGYWDGLLRAFVLDFDSLVELAESRLTRSLTQEECQQTLDYMRQNKIGSLFEAGVPPETAVAHRHGWISDTHADAAVISTPGGDYVIVAFLYKPDWLEWELSSPLLSDISRATYNYFNFDNPYLGEATSN